jgi:glucose/arabinose dehydrogenase
MPSRASFDAWKPSLTALGMILFVGGCGGCGGGSLDLDSADQSSPRRKVDRAAAGIAAPPGFQAIVAVEGLNYPSAMDWDDQGRLFILQSHSVDLPLTGVKIVRVEKGGELVDVDLEGEAAPTGKVAVGLTFHEGFFYLSHEEKDGTWGITRFHPQTGATEKVLRGLPAQADHWVNHLIFDKDGTLYFGIGSATNSGVVSSQDPVNLKWLEKRPQGRDIPCRDLTLLPASFSDDNGLTEAKDDKATTGAFQAYGSSGAATVAGEALCSSSVYRLPRGATQPELVAWGFRNPVGLVQAADGAIYVAAQGADIRGTRPVNEDGDALYRLKQGAWYGWPELGADLLPYTDPKYAVAAANSKGGADGPVALIDLAKSGLAAPDRSLLVYATEPHAAVCGIDEIPASGPFAKWAGQILVSEMGDFKPHTDALRPDVRAGFQIEAVDPKTGQATIFLRNARLAADGSAVPASTIDEDDGLERPVDVRIGPDGLVYVLDFGVFTPTAEAGKVFPKTGRVFRIEPGNPVAP